LPVTEAKVPGASMTLRQRLHDDLGKRSYCCGTARSGEEVYGKCLRQKAKMKETGRELMARLLSTEVCRFIAGIVR